MARHRTKTSHKKTRLNLKKVLRFLRKHQSVIAVAFIALGLASFALPLLWSSLRNVRALPSQEEATVVTSGQKSGSSTFGPIRIAEGLLSDKPASQPPTRIMIPRLAIDIPIREARVIDGYWEVFETTAGHGTGSGNPGEIGNMVIFAHARTGLFLSLRDIKDQDAVYVFTNDRWYRYRVSETKIVSPNEVEVIQPTSDETLTLFTCSGFLDTKRLVVIAKPD